MSDADDLPVPGAGQVLLFRAGSATEAIAREQAAARGAVLLDLGTDWAPWLLRSTPSLPHHYEATFIDLANGRFDRGIDGRRARHDRFLEVYGIPPSPALLARRFAHLDASRCVHSLDLSRLRSFSGVDWAGHTGAPLQLEQAILDDLQQRLRCETHLHDTPSGRFDAATLSALEEFERRNRIYARGRLDGATLLALQTDPLELERRALVRVLLERLVLDLGIIEDGSGSNARPAHAAGRRPEGAPDRMGRLEQELVRALGLSTVASTRRFYLRMQAGMRGPHYEVAIEAHGPPDHHSSYMDLFVEIDRGDLGYAPSFHAGTPTFEDGGARPTLTLFTRHQDRVIALARYGTTIGGWRIRRIDGEDQWVYKGSPVGRRVWARLESAPVWRPPRRTRPRALVRERIDPATGEAYLELDRNVVGPSYASAYGLAAAFHRRFRTRKGGTFELRGDEGIRTHGTADYTSIQSEASLGCHRLRNHLALRLFTFVLAHRPHERIGHEYIGFRRRVQVEDFAAVLHAPMTGFAFRLDPPVRVDVLRGRVHGPFERPPRFRIPVQPEPIELDTGRFSGTARSEPFSSATPGSGPSARLPDRPRRQLVQRVPQAQLNPRAQASWPSESRQMPR